MFLFQTESNDNDKELGFRDVALSQVIVNCVEYNAVLII